MFSPQIVDSDAFLDMSSTAQNLYFHLGMRADDDGFVGNPKKVSRIIGSNDDDLKLLLAKRFIIGFENGIVVIKHWRMNNLVRKDWYKPTQYIDQKRTLFLKEDGSYTEDSTKGVPLVNEPLTKMEHFVLVGKVRLGKVTNTRETDVSHKQITSLSEEKLIPSPEKMEGLRKVEAPFSFEEYVEKLSKSDKYVDQIIGIYWKSKGFTFGNIKQARDQFKADIKYARTLEAYERQQIVQTILFVKEDAEKIGYEWKISTLVKKIAIVTSKHD